MNLTDLERTQIAHNSLKRCEGWDELPDDARRTLLGIFSLGMIEQEVLDSKERLFEMNLEINKMRTNG